MCGRFTVNYTYDELVKFMDDEFSIRYIEDKLDYPRFNIAPGQQILSIIYDGYNYRAGTFKWGFIPSFSLNNNTGYKLINARSEGILEKVSFRDSFINRRCIVLADGFYEWDEIGGSKEPYYITFKKKKMMLFAGIWSKNSKELNDFFTVAILTTNANDISKDIHNRMPVILNKYSALKWLDDNTEIAELESLLQSYESIDMKKILVSRFVNKVSNDDLSCIMEIHDNKLF